MNELSANKLVKVVAGVGAWIYEVLQFVGLLYAIRCRTCCWRFCLKQYLSLMQLLKSKNFLYIVGYEFFLNYYNKLSTWFFLLINLEVENIKLFLQLLQE